MSIDERGAASGPAREASAWRRFLAWVQAFEEATDTSYDEIQDRRILLLAREVADLKAQHRGSNAEPEVRAGDASGSFR